MGSRGRVLCLGRHNRAMPNLAPSTRPRRRVGLAVAVPLVTLLASCAGVPSSTAPPGPGGEASAPAARASAPAVVEATVEQRFAQWVQAFRATASAAGIDHATLDSAFADVRYVPRAIERDRAQPEFTRTVWDYLDGAVSPQRITLGQEKLVQVRAEADAAAARYGVPAPVLVAIWGVESNYGSHYGDVPTIDALATLAFDGRREAWARAELIAALKILQNGDVDRAHLVGSWAGAMGQTQFLPSMFLAYAVDADGDGRRDIWGSLADVMASTANFLARAGWRAEEPWGAEVRLPPGFDAGRADGALRQSSAQWAAEGVQTVHAAPPPAIADAAILLPAGARGPALLVGANYRAILRYNNSTSYALAVGLLSQRLAGGPGIVEPWPRDLAALTRNQVLALQAALNERGFDSGTPDGVAGPATRTALRRWQRSVGLPADGYPTLELLERLQSSR
jgi:membrane-bound lytic murein transglycosylase B